MSTENEQKEERKILAMDYDGSLIHDRFGYEYFRDKYNFTGNIISFRGKMEVTTNLIDKEDLLNKDFIYSDDAINFCWEIPNVDAFAGVAFQRLYVTHVSNLLGRILGTTFIVSGDDILIRNQPDENAYKKASVSISTQKNGAVLGHLGINITAGDKAPAFAFSTNLSDDQLLNFVQEAEMIFYHLTRSISIATTKTVS